MNGRWRGLESKRQAAKQNNSGHGHSATWLWGKGRPAGEAQRALAFARQPVVRRTRRPPSPQPLAIRDNEKIEGITT